MITLPKKVDETELRTKDTDRDQSARSPNDQKLRRFGYTIYSRTESKEPEWMKDGKIYPEHEALIKVNKEIKAIEATVPKS